MGIVVYSLCALASLTCAVLLFRGYRRTRQRLLFWSALCFGCFCLNNLVLIVDVRMLPERDLSVLRSIPSLVGIALLIYGLVWDSAE
jgi:hypothetical protein